MTSALLCNSSQQSHVFRRSNTFPSEPTLDIFVDRQLGSGRFKVYHAYLSFDETEYALKTFPRDKASDASYNQEKNIISRLNHKNIIKYASNIQLMGVNSTTNVILMEYAPYGSFYELVLNKGLTEEKLMRTYFHQLMKGMEYLHSQGIAHVDLKLDNLLLGEDFVLKITDFDQSQMITETKLKGRGTSCYRAPEVLEGQCEDYLAADMYSLGVVLYTAKAREFPFVERGEGVDTKLLHYDLFTKKNVEFWRVKVEKRSSSEFFSQSFKELINGLLEKNPKKRWSIEDVKKSRWYNESIFGEEELKEKMEKVWERIMFKKSMKRGGSPSN